MESNIKSNQHMNQFMCWFLFMLLSISSCVDYSLCYFPSVHVLIILYVTFHQFMCWLLFMLLSISSCVDYSLCYFPSVHVLITLYVTFHQFMCWLLFMLLSFSSCVDYLSTHELVESNIKSNQHMNWWKVT
jgi:uncharacterized membrane protein